jgi:hypothetical protein
VDATLAFTGGFDLLLLPVSYYEADAYIFYAYLSQGYIVVKSCGIFLFNAVAYNGTIHIA